MSLDRVIELAQPGRPVDALRDEKGRYLKGTAKPCSARYGSADYWLARLKRDGRRPPAATGAARSYASKVAILP